MNSVLGEGCWIGRPAAAVAAPRCTAVQIALWLVHGRALFQGNDVLRVLVLSSLSSVCLRGKQHVLRQLPISRCVRPAIAFQRRIAYYTTSSSVLEKVGDAIPSINAPLCSRRNP